MIRKIEIHREGQPVLEVGAPARSAGTFNAPKILVPGEKFSLNIWGTEPNAVEIKCFVKSPPPPGYKPCPECGFFYVKNGEPVNFTVEESTFGQPDGAIHVSISDADGDTVRLKLGIQS